nr:hypothetical protein [Tanacetum cinerariifolium]
MIFILSSTATRLQKTYGMLLRGICLDQNIVNKTGKLRCNKTAKDLWDALARHMLGSEYGKQDRKAAVLYEYETFKATEGELLLDTYIRYLQQNQGDVNDAMGSKKKTVVDTSNPLALIAEKTNVSRSKEKVVVSSDFERSKADDFRDVNDAMGSKKKTVVVTYDPLALIAEKTNVSRSKEKVVVSSNSEGSETDDFSELKKITALLAKAFN